MEIYFFLLDFNLKSILKQLKNRFLYMYVLHMSHILQICQLFQNTCDIIISTTLARLLMENNKDVICVEHNMYYICKNKFAVKTLHLFSEGRVFSYVEYTLKIKITFLEGGIKHDKPNPSLS